MNKVNAAKKNAGKKASFFMAGSGRTRQNYSFGASALAWARPRDGTAAFILASSRAFAAASLGQGGMPAFSPAKILPLFSGFQPGKNLRLVR